jgi:hypothetical protein
MNQLLYRWEKKRWRETFLCCFKQTLIKWLWEFFLFAFSILSRGVKKSFERNIFIWFCDVCNLQAYTKWKTCLKVDINIRSMGMCSFKWHANQFDGIQIVFNLNAAESALCVCNLEMLVNALPEIKRNISHRMNIVFRLHGLLALLVQRVTVITSEKNS